MFFTLVLCISIGSSCLALEKTNSSNASMPRSPREQLGVKDKVIRQYDRNKKGKIIREIYQATLENGTLISIDCTFDKKGEHYLGFWRRSDKPARSIAPEHAEDYFKKLKIAYLQNKVNSQP